MTVLWTVSTFNYYLIILQVKHFPGDFNENTIVMFGADLVSFLIGGYLIKRFSA